MSAPDFENGLTVSIRPTGNCPATLLAFLLLDIEETRPDSTVNTYSDEAGSWIELWLPAEPQRFQLPVWETKDELLGMISHAETANLVHRELTAALRDALAANHDLGPALIEARANLDEAVAQIEGLQVEIAQLRARPEPAAVAPFEVGDDPHPDGRKIGPAPAPKRRDTRQPGKTRRQFTDAQKRSGADLARSVGVAKAAKQVGVVESVIRGWMKVHPPKADGVGGGVGGQLESTPSDQTLDNSPAAVVDGLDLEEVTAGGETTSATDGARNLPADTPTNPTDSVDGRNIPTAVRNETVETSKRNVETVEILAILDHPEWIDGATARTGGSWVRTDGELWECTCGRKVRTIAHLRSHMGGVVNPDLHRPLNVTSRGDGNSRVVNHDSRLVAMEALPEVKEVSEVSRKPLPEAQAVDKSLPFACSCHARFPTGHDWSDHVKTQPTHTRNRHHLTEQPAAVMVPSGIHLAPPARPTGDDILHVEPHQHRTSA